MTDRYEVHGADFTRRGKSIARRRRLSIVLPPLLGGAVATGLVGMLFAIDRAEQQATGQNGDRTTRRAVPLPGDPQLAATPPVVEPTVLMDLKPDAARTMNAAVPFLTGPLQAARPFNFKGTPENEAAARICLAAAVLYEAGDSRIDQYAVAQVVLNRARHPAFPKTICGVVFQGSERSTGCQFTFTCDGALRRQPNPDAWSRALGAADLALHGFVFTPVGTATHYHTDWVFPYWQSSLDKIASVRSHIFYRWKGFWGTPAAFVGVVNGVERVDPRLARFAGNAAGPAPVQQDLTPIDIPLATSDSLPPLSLRVPGVPAGLLKGNSARLVDDGAGTVVLKLDTGAFPGSYAVVGNAICADRKTCLVAGFADESSVPKSLPLTASVLRQADFLYRKAAGDVTQMLWNCTRFPRPASAECRP